jgi:hypothetical protein
MRKRNKREGNVPGEKVQERKKNVVGSKLNSRNSEIHNFKVQAKLGSYCWAVIRHVGLLR